MSYPLRFTAEVRDRWVEALHSGEYIQGEGQLTTPGVDAWGDYLGPEKDCCLGVLRKLYINELGSYVQPDDGMLTDEEDGDTLVYGLDEELQTDLTRMNDGSEHLSIRKHDFTQIADFIQDLPVVD